MQYKITILEPGLHIQDLYIELHHLSRKERKMTCHQNPGSDNNSSKNNKNNDAI